MARGWFGEPRRHALAAKGIETGRKASKPIYRPFRHIDKETEEIMEIQREPGEYESEDIVIRNQNGEFTKEEIIDAVFNMRDVYGENTINPDMASAIVDWLLRNTPENKLEEIFWWRDARGVPVPSPDIFKETMKKVGLIRCKYCNEVNWAHDMDTSSEGYPICNLCEDTEDE